MEMEKVRRRDGVYDRKLRFSRTRNISLSFYISLYLILPFPLPRYPRGLYTAHRLMKNPKTTNRRSFRFIQRGKFPVRWIAEDCHQLGMEKKKTKIKNNIWKGRIEKSAVKERKKNTEKSLFVFATRLGGGCRNFTKYIMYVSTFSIPYRTAPAVCR